MSEEEVTETNNARYAREAKARLRGETPTAKPGGLAEKFGYAQPFDRSAFADHIQGNLKYADNQSDRARWLGRRQAGLGSSDIAVLMGWGFSNQSEWKLYAEKKGLLPYLDDDDPDEIFEFGKRMEPVLAQWFHDETGLWVGNEQEHREHPMFSWAMATIDGEVLEGPDHEGLPLGGVEFKTTGDRPWDTVPDKYVAQCQWQMFVCGWDQVWLAALHGRSFRIYEIPRDEGDIKLLFDRARDWWERYIVGDEVPDTDASQATSGALRDVYPGDPDTTVVIPELGETVAWLREAKRMRKQWEETEAELTNRVKASLGDYETLELGDGYPVLSWKRFDTTRVDTKELKALFPDIYDAVAHKSPTSRFTLIDPPKEK